jgi:molybdopterin molybdotransferase
MLPFLEARARALAAVRDAVHPVVADGPLAPGFGRGLPEEVPLAQAFGRVLADDVRADRDQPPFNRSTRDGYAVRAVDVPGVLRVGGEIAAGQELGRELRPEEAVEIMTGAPLPAGADAVVMVEHTRRAGDRVSLEREVAPGENVVPAGSELPAGALAIPAGTFVGVGEVALLASLGHARPRVRRRPRVAVLPTGDELVDVAATPGPTQIRNSNGPMLAAQIDRAGGTPIVLPAARDDLASLRALARRAFDEADLVILSGGVSMGKHDLVEGVLAELGARFLWDAVAIRPGKPAVCGLAGDRPFLGLPGNPLSSLVTFELFARPLIELLAGAEPRPFTPLRAPLAALFRQPPLPLTVFAPARLDERGLHLIASQGSGDLASIVRAGGFALFEPGVTDVAAGTLVPYLPR